MARTDNKLCGLTRLIYDGLISQTLELMEAGDNWSPEILDRVEDELMQKFAPRPSQRDQLIFNMVYHRSFAEAKKLLLGSVSLTPSQSVYPEPAIRQAAQAMA